METVWQFLRQLNIDSLHDPAIPFLGMYPREMNTHVHKILDMYVHSSIIHNGQKVEIIETTQISINWWMDKQKVVYPYNRILFIGKKKVLIYAATWINLENVMQSERIQP